MKQLNQPYFLHMMSDAEVLAYENVLRMATAAVASATGKEKVEIDPKIDGPARERLITSRIGLLLKAPFFGNIATRLELLNGNDWCPTAATDGRRFYYNDKFVMSLPLKQCEFLMGHEVLHAVYDHSSRRNGRDPKIWNFACDFAVNQDLIDQRIGEKITVVKILQNDKYKNMSAEEIYEDLVQNASKMDLEQYAKMLLDEHLDPESGNGPPMSEDERRAIRDELQEAVLSAAEAAGAGNLPGGVKRLLSHLTAPVISWKELLEQQIQSTVKCDFSFSRPSRRSWHMDAILPGMIVGDAIEVDIAIDQSGSIGEEDARAFLSEIKGIMEAYEQYKIRVWCFDTEVYNCQEFNSDNMDSIESYVPMGCGGTDFMCNWRFMRENDIQPKKFIMFTDGVPFGEWGEEEYCDTVWIIKGNENCVPPWGTWAIYEHSASKSK
jgi:predicted metal-dependent peptidase